MSVETFSPLPLVTFGTWTTLLDPSDVPPGMSPSAADVEFFPGGVRTRPGLLSVFSPLNALPSINGLKTYITTNLVQRLIVLDSIGRLWRETSPGSLTNFAAIFNPGLFMSSATQFGREYMAFSDGAIGQDMPRQFDDTFFDRVSQVGPGEGPAAADATDSGSISPGAHQVVVIFVTRQGFWTAPSPPVTWTAAGGKKVNVTNIPTGPANVVARLLAFTAAGGVSFFQVPATMTINDNTTTSLEVDFSDAILLAGVSMDNLFANVELPDQLGVIPYSERLFWWGERAKMPNWRNLSFDGGWDSSGNGRPLGWQIGSPFGAGGSRESLNVIWGDAYKITADGLTVERGLIQQSAVTDAAGNPLLTINTDYSVRARVSRSVNLTQGTFRINVFSPSKGALGSGLAVSQAQAQVNYQEFTAQLIFAQTPIPSDAVLRVYADGLPSPAGEAFFVDNIEIFPTNTANSSSVVRASRNGDPEAYDGVQGLIEVAVNNGQAIRAAFVIRNLLYFAKERSLYVTADDGTNEPAFWSVEEVSNSVGTPSAHGVGIGEDWVVIADRSGLYYFDGGVPQKLSQEIQPAWDAINWQYGSALWVTVDTQHKRIYCGVPMGSATQPNQILVLDYSEGFADPIVTMLYAPGRARKWVPWIISANSAAMVERSNGTASLFVGNNAANGKIYQLTEGQFSDDGLAINSFYSTAFLSRTGATGRNLFGYLTTYAQGTGTLNVTAFTPGDATQSILGALALASPAGRDLELMTNVVGERVAYQFGTNAAGSWFSLTKLVPWSKPEPWAFLRGPN
ncbi:MAG TPA: hypothetical protein VGR72_07265 [Candidatus Acidoferrales bacterium]|nr:hypothetical protein [Candidatus Acidoferrales bacterium]